MIIEVDCNSCKKKTPCIVSEICCACFKGSPQGIEMREHYERIEKRIKKDRTIRMWLSYLVYFIMFLFIGFHYGNKVQIISIVTYTVGMFFLDVGDLILYCYRQFKSIFIKPSCSS